MSESPAPAVERIPPEEADQRMRDQGHPYLDVRTPAEFDLGHPAGAYNIPWKVPGAHGLVPNSEFARTVRAHFAEDAPLILGCATGRRSLEAATALSAAGYSRIADQLAGFDGVRDPFGAVHQRGWRTLGLPESLLAEPGRSHRELCQQEETP